VEVALSAEVEVAAAVGIAGLADEIFVESDAALASATAAAGAGAGVPAPAPAVIAAGLDCFFASTASTAVATAAAAAAAGGLVAVTQKPRLDDSIQYRTPVF